VNATVQFDPDIQSAVGVQNGWNPLRTSKREPSSYSDKSNSKASDAIEIAAKSGIVRISLVDFVYPPLTMLGKDRAEASKHCNQSHAGRQRWR
jgi:hypothetical protein